MILVAGIGNIFLGDDGFGPEVVRHLTAAESDALPEDVRVVDYGIRGMHLAYDLLQGYDALVLVDAYPGQGDPGEVQVLEVRADDVRSPAGPELDAHGMDPLTALRGLAALGGEMPPTYLVGAPPLDLREHIGLSEPLAAAVPVGASTVRSLLSERLRVPAGPFMRGG